GVDARAVSELLDDPGPRHRLEVLARLAELDAVALDLADAEALPDEVAEPDAARRHLPPRLARCEAGRLDVLRLDQRERLARLRARRAEVTVALEPLAGDRAHRVDRQ